MSAGAGVSQVTLKGWEALLLENDRLAVTVIPGKGGDIVSVIDRRTGVELLWQSRWGLRERGAATQPASSEASSMEAYAGGWQTIFPNAGDPSFEEGVEWGFHGEVWITPFEWAIGDDGVLELVAHLVRSPFLVRKSIELRGEVLRVTETITNESRQDIEVMWGQHPAFGGPLVAPNAVIETSATLVNHDPLNAEYGAVPAAQNWPQYVRPDGVVVDLSRVGAADAGETRMAFLGTFPPDAWAAIDNSDLDLRAELHWNPAEFPTAWYWHESGGRRGFPWFASAYVVALEPNTSWPGRGLSAARESTGTQIIISAGETQQRSVELRVGNSRWASR